MTIDELQALISTGDPKAMAAALDADTSSDRPKLTKAACQAAVEGLGGGSYRSGETPEQAQARWDLFRRQRVCAWLAIFRLGSWKDIRQLHRQASISGEMYTELFEVLFPWLERQRPPWIEQYVAFLLDNHQDYFEWSWIRRLMRAGICDRPTTDNYLLRMPRDLDGLRADPAALQDELWRLFQHVPRGTSALIFPADLDHADAPDSGSFAGALKQLAAEGAIERQRLLTASLEALQLGRKPNDAIWFYKFHEFLEPSPDERAHCQRLYVDLLDSAVPAVVSFALAALQELAKAKRLDGPGFVAQAPRALAARTKGASLAALKLLGQIAKGDASLKEDVAGAACAALAHENAEVQKAAIGLVESLKVAPPAQVVAALEAQLDAVAPSLREHVRELCQQWRTTATGPAGRDPPAAQGPQREDREAGADTTTLLTEAAALDDVQRELAGIADCLRALSDGAALSPVDVDPTRLQHLSPDRAQTPIHSLDELIEEASSALEKLDDADQLERLLDGLSRLCAQRPADFNMRTAPLAKRVDKLAEDRIFNLELDPAERLIKVVRTWLRGTPGPRVPAGAPKEIEPAPAPPIIHDEPSPGELAAAQENLRRPPYPREFLELFARWAKAVPALTFLQERLHELETRLRRCDARPLLAAPTHRGGWVSARAFIERLTALEQAGLEPESFDLRQALMRLAPDERDPILSRATDLTGLGRKAIEWALDRIKPTEQSEVGVYIAAKTGREPFAPLLASENPPVLVPLRFIWKATRDLAHGESAQPRWSLIVTTEPNAFENPLFRFPPLTLCPIAHHAGRVRWASVKTSSLAQLWPINPAPFFAAGAVAVVSELETTNADVRQLPDFLKPMLAPQAPFSEMAQLLLAVSLLAKSADQRGLAVDVLLAVIEDGRCLGAELGAIFHRLLPCGMVRANRLAEALNTAARASLLHKSVCARIVQTMFSSPEDAEHVADAHHLLAPLLEWLTETTEPLRDSFRDTLAAFTGTSKTGKLARSLEQRTTPANPSQQQAIVLEALRGRLAATPRRLGMDGEKGDAALFS